MEENDISNVIDKFSSILKEKNIDINDFKTKKEPEDDSPPKENNNEFNLDINTILKFKKIADNLNTNDNPRTSLLQALKPFLTQEKQSKIDDYIKIFNILNILEILNKEI